MCAALVLSQLSKIDSMVKKRNRHAQLMNFEFEHVEGVRCPNPPAGFKHVYQLYTIVLSDENIRNRLQQFMTERGIMTKVYFDPVHLTTFYRKNFGCKKGDLPITEALSMSNWGLSNSKGLIHKLSAASAEKLSIL